MFSVLADVDHVLPSSARAEHLRRILAVLRREVDYSGEGSGGVDWTGRPTGSSARDSGTEGGSPSLERPWSSVPPHTWPAHV